jgi:hypothetical protein
MMTSYPIRSEPEWTTKLPTEQYTLITVSRQAIKDYKLRDPNIYCQYPSITLIALHRWGNTHELLLLCHNEPFY